MCYYIGLWVNIIIHRNVDMHVVNCRERRKYIILRHCKTKYRDEGLIKCGEGKFCSEGMSIIDKFSGIKVMEACLIFRCSVGIQITDIWFQAIW